MMSRARRFRFENVARHAGARVDGCAPLVKMRYVTEKMGDN